MQKVIPLLIFLTLFLFSCDNQQKAELNPQWDYKNIRATGEIKSDSFTFCGFIPKSVEYDYKVGHWTFYSKQHIKIAEGIYEFILKQLMIVAVVPIRFMIILLKLQNGHFGIAMASKYL